MNVNEITHRIIGAAIEVHKETGPGLLESAYKACFATQLTSDGLRVRQEVAVPLFYKGTDVGVGYRLDLLVEETVVVEVKAVERVDPVFMAQLIILEARAASGWTPDQLQRAAADPRCPPNDCWTAGGDVS